MYRHVVLLEWTEVSDDGDSTHPETSVRSSETTRRCVPEGFKLHNLRKCLVNVYYYELLGVVSMLRS
jgi:hypothetical protein